MLCVPATASPSTTTNPPSPRPTQGHRQAHRLRPLRRMWNPVNRYGPASAYACTLCRDKIRRAPDEND